LVEAESALTWTVAFAGSTQRTDAETVDVTRLLFTYVRLVVERESRRTFVACSGPIHVTRCVTIDVTRIASMCLGVDSKAGFTLVTC
jgi:hypothetical protein